MNRRALSIQLAMLGLAILAVAAFDALARPPATSRELGFYASYATPLLFALLGSFVLLVAGIFAGQSGFDATPHVEAHTAARPQGQRPAQPASPESPLQFHPLNPVAFKLYFAGLKAAPNERKVKITEAAAAIAEGRNPVVLAELLAYALAIAARPDASDYAKVHVPIFAKAAAFNHKSLRALVFLFEGVAFIVLAGPETESRWTRLRHATALRTGRRQNVPGETVWDAAPRHRGFAEDWDGIRPAIESWVTETAIKNDPDRTFILAGYDEGGALAVLAAYEFAKRVRKISAVVAFDAPTPGGKAFAHEYDRLGLDERTLFIESAATRRGLKELPLIYAPVGRAWRLDKSPLLARTAADPGESAKPLPPLLARFALPLTILVYQRLREIAGPGGTPTEYNACYAALVAHLAFIRGTAKGADSAFAPLDELPIKIADVADHQKLKAEFPERLF